MISATIVALAATALVLVTGDLPWLIPAVVAAAFAVAFRIGPGDSSYLTDEDRTVPWDFPTGADESTKRSEALLKRR
jgi:hypothetical protein